jgi:hypothetical protein
MIIPVFGALKTALDFLGRITTQKLPRRAQDGETVVPEADQERGRIEIVGTRGVGLSDVALFKKLLEVSSEYFASAGDDASAASPMIIPVSQQERLETVRALCKQ